MKTRLFDEYLFADYSGGKEDGNAQSSIVLCTLSNGSKPERLQPERSRAKNFSRNSLTDFVLDRLTSATEQNRRVIFGFDHQFAWPRRLREHAGIERMDWRSAIDRLSNGEHSTGLPPLDIPKRYCQLFNQFSGVHSFWTTFDNVAKNYGISTKRPKDALATRFRLSEVVKPIRGRSRPKPADAVGGTGEGVVGGQTICGLRQISRMLARRDIAWWPFDGLNINSDCYVGKHVGVEIYPSAVREGRQLSDEHDAQSTCLAIRNADRQGELRTLMQLEIPRQYRDQVRKEGWIIGMDPDDIPEAIERVIFKDKDKRQDKDDSRTRRE